MQRGANVVPESCDLASSGMTSEQWDRRAVTALTCYGVSSRCSGVSYGISRLQNCTLSLADFASRLRRGVFRLPGLARGGPAVHEVGRVRPQRSEPGLS